MQVIFCSLLAWQWLVLDNPTVTRYDPYQQTTKLIFDPDHCLMYGAYVRGVRSALGLSQSALAEMLGVNRTTLLRLEKGQPPLKKALCETAVEVLKKAGVQSEAMDSLITEPGVPTTLDIGINFGALMHSLYQLPKSAAVDAKTEALFGQNYVPPLEQAPLRKK
jgi:DNA-binding XRE family transcriptional regulator